MPLVASSVGTDQLLGGPGSRPAAVDPLAARTLVKGEPLAAPAGRADDFSWPRREIGREQAKGETPVAAATPDGTIVPPAPAAAAIQTPPKPKKPRQIQSGPPGLRELFGGFGNAPRQPPRPGAATTAQRRTLGLGPELLHALADRIRCACEAWPEDLLAQL